RTEPADPIENRLVRANEPFAGSLEPIRRRRAVEAQERRFVEIEAGALVAQANENAIAPAGEAEGVAGAELRDGQPGQPCSPRRQVVEVLIEEGNDPRQRREQISRRS